MKRFSKHLATTILTLVAFCGLVAGVLLLFSPIPIGIVLIAVSLSVLIYIHDGVQHIVREIRRDYDALNERLHWVEEKLARRVSFVSQALNRTRPDLVQQSRD